MKKLLASLVIVGGLLTATTVAADARTTAKPSCTRALDHADRIIDLNKQFATAVNDHMSAVGAAAHLASVDNDTVQFLNTMTSSVKAFGDRVDVLTVLLTPEITAYKATAAKCHAGK